MRFGLALIVGSGNYLKPDVPLPQVSTAFVYLGCWFLMAGVVYYFLGDRDQGQVDRADRLGIGRGHRLIASATSLKRGLPWIR
jgi:MFS transporter, putative metabolite:H+ symporter